MSEKFSVWARSSNEEWTREKNAGCSDMLILHSVTRGQAEGLVDRLTLLYGDETLEIHPANKPPVPGSVGAGS